MIYVILCGGAGVRNSSYSLPKPLNYINGKHLIEYTIESIKSDIIYIIYNIALDEYNFKQIVINKFKHKIFHFASIAYLTRGAVETAYVGINKFDLSDDNILFIDNDNYSFMPVFDKYDTNFICYGINTDEKKTNYSFILIDENTKNVTQIEEKNKISNNYCCGLYGFVNKTMFNNLSEILITKNLKTKNEFYFSYLYKLIIYDKQYISPIYISETLHLGSYKEIIDNCDKLQKPHMRICFDLDNTLVTYPTIPNDYSSVNPIQKNIDLLTHLKSLGHTIIIYTARRMQTHNNNVGKTIKDIGILTLQTLDKYNIQYDEFIFGKPIADVYIDDKSLNPYHNDISMFGLFGDNDNMLTKFIQNKVPNNKFNKINKIDNHIIKTGPCELLKGELYFYQNIPSQFKKYFVDLISYEHINDCITIKLEYINGIPLYFLYKYNTMTKQNICALFDVCKSIHSDTSQNIVIDKCIIKKHYIDKLKKRFNKIDYNFDDAESIYNDIINKLEKYYNPKISSLIHGDFWFSNIILTYNDEIKLIDMRGKICDILTLNGDIYYDYGKLYQSILGYDLVLNNDVVNKEYIDLFKTFFINKCIDIGLDINYLTIITKSLIFGTIYFIPSNEQKINVWNLIKSIDI